MPDFIRDVHYGDTLWEALRGFQGELTRLWREILTEKMVHGDRDDYPRGLQPPWANWWVHPQISHIGQCSFVGWVKGGQRGPLESITCEGTIVAVPQDGREGTGRIACGMAAVLRTVEDWAYAECKSIFAKFPVFHGHDLTELEKAHHAFLECGGRLVLRPGPGSASGLADDSAFPRSSAADFAYKVHDISGGSGVGQDWWAGWTGLAANAVKSGFLQSVAPTAHNQSAIAGCLANLYATRAAIIEKARHDSMFWIQWATKSLKQDKPDTPTSLEGGWKVLQAIGSVIQIGGAFAAPVVGAAGTVVNLVGFIGENLIPGFTTEGKWSKRDLEEVLEQFRNKIDELSREIGNREEDYKRKVWELDDTIYGIHSYDLELYDLTRNDPHGTPADPVDSRGFTVVLESVLKIAQQCYEAGSVYALAEQRIKYTYDADEHLSDRDHHPQEGDRMLLAIRDMLAELLKTSCGRFLVAGDQITAAAEIYAQSDANAKAYFDNRVAEWRAEHVGPHTPGYPQDADEYKDHAGDTHRPDEGDYPGASNQSPSTAPGGESESNYDTTS